MSASGAPSLFDEIVAALEPTLRSVAPFVLTRLLLRAGVFDRTTMSIAEFREALPVLEAGFAESLPPNELADVMSGVHAVLQRHQGEGPRVAKS